MVLGRVFNCFGSRLGSVGLACLNALGTSASCRRPLGRE
jgi:hypothetical protein